jgi:hypothetical protein
MSERARIPTPEEHKRRTRRIWLICGCISLFVLVSIGGTVAILVADNDVHEIVGWTTIIFQIVIGMFATGFTTPLFLEQRANFILSIDMGRESLELGTETAGAMIDLKNEFVPVVKDLKSLVDQMKPVVEVANRQVQDGYLEKIEKHMEAIRKAIEKQSAPIPTKPRNVS